VSVPDRLPMPLRLYRLASAAVAPRLLAWRARRGKEHPTRLAERRGEAAQPRPRGPLIWIHGASVGEMLAAVPLIERICAQQFAVLVTSGTLGSAALAERRLPPDALHQFLPLDAPRYVARFLDHWRPDLALFIESDLWPNLILAAAQRRVPLIIVNGRLSERSFRRWQRMPRAIAALLSRFDLCLTQSRADAERYAELGAPRISSTGNLKLDVPGPPVDESMLLRWKTAVTMRPVVVAASTHPGEENAVINAHRQLRGKNADLLTIIAPRHPERGDSIAALATAAGLSVGQRSKGDLPKQNVDLYVADTLGELGLIYRLASIVFMGGSLATHGGQNPIEAIRLGAAVLHGPNVWNFAEIYNSLDASQGAKLVPDEAALTQGLADWLGNPSARRMAFDAATKTVQELGGALDRTLIAIDPYLVSLRLQQRAP
jgi:3-deoxy-D-manno-octulosonic-acid transferase